MTTESNRFPYLLLAGAVSGAVGYLFFTKSGHAALDRMSQARVNAAGTVADKIEDARQFIEDRGNDLNDLSRQIMDHTRASVEAGKRAYERSAMEYRTDMARLKQRNAEAVANIHRAVDNLNEVFQTVQDKVLEPICDMGAMVRGIGHGFERFVQGPKSDADPAAPIYAGSRFSG